MDISTCKTYDLMFFTFLTCRLFLWNTIPEMKVPLRQWWQRLMLLLILLVWCYCHRYIVKKCCLQLLYVVNGLQTGREYETRNYSFEEVNHHMAEQLAVVCFCYPFMFSSLIFLALMHISWLFHGANKIVSHIYLSDW